MTISLYKTARPTWTIGPGRGQYPYVYWKQVPPTSLILKFNYWLHCCRVQVPIFNTIPLGVMRLDRFHLEINLDLNFPLELFTLPESIPITVSKREVPVHFPWASYQIRKIAGCACAGNAGNVFPRRRFQRKPIVSDPGMHHGTCVTHVPWCMSGSLTCGDGENVPGIPGACASAILRIWQEAHWEIYDALFLSVCAA